MGAIWSKRAEIISSTGDIVGYKSGMTLSLEQLKSHTEDGYQNIFSDNQDAIIRIRSEEYEYFLAHILYRLGVISTDNIAPFIIRLFHKYKDDTHAYPTFFELSLYLYTAFEKNLEEIFGTDFIPFSPIFDKKDQEAILHISMAMTALISQSIKDNQFGFRKDLFKTSVLKLNLYKRNEILDDLLIGLTDYVQRSPWINYRCIDWKDNRNLDDLFKSEGLQSCHGNFFDQRFIDYLSSQNDDIGKIHWRQFEGLASEYLHREGYIVDLGTGRNDDSVDIRAWREKPQKDSPPTILVQCKRQKAKVDKVVVKALWADIVNEQAQSGLIVTSSALLPGAKKTQVARAYPITEINRTTLIEWILKMRTPRTGIFLSE